MPKDLPPITGSSLPPAGVTGGLRRCLFGRMALQVEEANHYAGYGRPQVGRGYAASAWRDATVGGVPEMGDPRHAEPAAAVKAVRVPEQQPAMRWIGVRAVVASLRDVVGGYR